MKPFVRLVVKPDIQVETLVGLVNEFAGENLWQEVQSCSRQLDKTAETLAGLMAFRGGTEDALQSIRNSGPVQPHFKYVFLIFSSDDAWEEINQLNAGLTLTYASHKHSYFSFVSGNLDDWQKAVVWGSQSENAEVRYIFDLIFLEFEKTGLSEIWFHNKRVALPDKTFYLED